MEKQDARKLNHRALTDLRRRAVAAVQSGQSPEFVARVFGVSRSVIYGWLSLYRHGGWGALDTSKRRGRPRKLDGPALRWIYDTVTTKNPLQLKFAFALWTTSMIATLIEMKFEVCLNRTSVCRLLNHLGLIAQRPMLRAYEQDPVAVEKWLSEEFHKIKTLARRTNAEVFYASCVTPVRPDFHSGTTRGKQGKTPAVSATEARSGFNLISATSPVGHRRFMVTKGRVGAKVIIEFLKRLIYNSDRMIFLIVDDLPAHKAKSVSKYVASIKECLRLFYLPADSLS